eukprot:SAG11_NODE_5619_length_1506_cov_1.194741_1_plen_26_part_10
MLHGSSDAAVVCARRGRDVIDRGQQS